jgi:hypothetical protein
MILRKREGIVFMSVTPTPDDANGLSLDASAQRIKDVRLKNFVDSSWWNTAKSDLKAS